jgi:coenzyme F420-reducing hydrogenase delta subunit
MNYELLFRLLALLFMAAAAYFLWTTYTDGVFVAGVLAAVCYFLSVRFQIKRRMRKQETDESEKQSF